jgi:hypothetical protein
VGFERYCSSQTGDPSNLLPQNRPELQRRSAVIWQLLCQASELKAKQLKKLSFAGFYAAPQSTSTAKNVILNSHIVRIFKTLEVGFALYRTPVMLG